MRILLCLNRDLMSNLALNLLWPALDGHVFDIVLSRGVAPSAPRAREIAEWQALEHRYVEGGLFPLLNARMVAGRFQSFEQCATASETGKPLGFANINRGDGLAHVRRFAPDTIVSMRFGQIYRQQLIALPRFGILNLHSGTLPEYRGVLATFWAMLEGAPEIGCTLHYVTDGTIDTGAIIGTHSRAPEPSRSLLWNVASLYPGGASLIGDAITRLSRGETLVACSQDERRGRYFSYPGEEQVVQFHERGCALYSREDYVEIFGRYGLSEAEITDITSKSRAG
jgi:methionyl-tRNA formyltransferase